MMEVTQAVKALCPTTKQDSTDSPQHRHTRARQAGQVAAAALVAAQPSPDAQAAAMRRRGQGRRAAAPVLQLCPPGVVGRCRVVVQEDLVHLQQTQP